MGGTCPAVAQVLGQGAGAGPPPAPGSQGVGPRGEPRHAGGWMCGPSTKQDPRKTPLSVRGLLGTQGARLSPCRLQVGRGLGPGPRLGSRLKITTSVWSGTLWGRMSIGTDRRLQWDRQRETRTARHVGSKMNQENGRERRERSSEVRTRPDTSEGTPLAPDGRTARTCPAARGRGAAGGERAWGRGAPRPPVGRRRVDGGDSRFSVSGLLSSGADGGQGSRCHRKNVAKANTT